MTADVKESVATVANEANKAKYRALLDELQRQRKTRAGLVESRYFRWISGDLPEILELFVKDHELALALLEDALRYRREHPKPPAPDATDD
jgi:hypothetical protein